MSFDFGATGTSSQMSRAVLPLSGLPLLGTQICYLAGMLAGQPTRMLQDTEECDCEPDFR